MVRASLKNFVNLRTRDIFWWGNGRKSLISNKQLRKERDDLDNKVFKSNDSESAIGNLIGSLNSTDSGKLLDSIKSLERLYMQKYDPNTSRKLVKEQAKLFQNADAIDPNVKRAFNEALTKWESP